MPVQDHDGMVRTSLAMAGAKSRLFCSPDEVQAVQLGKLALKYSGRSELIAMSAIASAAKKRSLSDFNTAFGRYRDELQHDAVIKVLLYMITTLFGLSHFQMHFRSLSEGMLEKELQRLLEPFSCVEITHVAKLIDMQPVSVMSAKRWASMKGISAVQGGEEAVANDAR